jgi:hypothetical protein
MTPEHIKENLEQWVKDEAFHTIAGACGDLIREVERLRNSYRCYSCKQTFAEDHGHGLAREHFGSHLNGDQPKCLEILTGKATWGGGPHDPFYRVRKEHYDALEKEVVDLRARCEQWRARDEAAADDRAIY